MQIKKKKITYKQLFLFFLPLAITPTIIGTSHSIIDAALARLPQAELSIAVFSIVKAFTGVIKGPVYMSRQVTASLVNDRDSYFTAMKFLAFLTLIILSILLIIAFTPIGGWIFRNIIGLKGEDEIRFAYIALRITAFLPIVEYLRNSAQGVVISLEKTRLILPGIILRLLFISTLLWWTVNTQAILGITAGSITWLTGIGIEAVFITATLFYLYKSPAQAAELIPNKNESRLNYKELFKFFLPLAVMMSFAAMIPPIIQSGLARSFSPTQSLAAFGVSLGLLFVITGSLSMLHNVSIVYGDHHGDQNWSYIIRFCLAVGIVLSIIILMIAVTPVGFWAFNTVIGVSVEITNIAQNIMLVFVLIPLIRAVRESYWGLLMTERNTKIIGAAKLANIIAVVFSLLPALLIKSIHPAVLGAAAYTFGEAVETAVISFQAVKK
ncbi:MAG: hypothetical protein ACOCW0_01790 [Halanaerobium sp.]